VSGPLFRRSQRLRAWVDHRAVVRAPAGSLDTERAKSDPNDPAGKCHRTRKTIALCSTRT
jgi:hypothetical protein